MYIKLNKVIKTYKMGDIIITAADKVSLQIWLVSSMFSRVVKFCTKL